MSLGRGVTCQQETHTSIVRLKPNGYIEVKKKIPHGRLYPFFFPVCAQH